MTDKNKSHHENDKNKSHHENDDKDCHVPCFVSGTKIATKYGEKNVENLKVGDLILTRDNGFKELVWIGSITLTDESAKIHAPIIIPKHSFDKNKPYEDLLVSPNHKLLSIFNNLWVDHETLIEAKHLIGKFGVRSIFMETVVYNHFMFDQHELVLSNGMWTESFQLTERNVNSDETKELKNIFSDVFDEKYFVSARTVLKKYESELV